MSRYDRKDHYHRRAKREGFRSRAAYKLAEIQGAWRLLRPGQRVVDLGCWPGGWLQVASRAVGSTGRVVGVDIAAVDPLEENENVVALCLDLAQPPAAAEILRVLGGPADVLLSDAAPKLTGVRPTDRAREEALLEAIERLLPQLLRPGGDLLVKILECPEARTVEGRIRGRFERARTLSPSASRRGTTERYLLARGHRGVPG
ncbi:RlmE family RNA methyltransferase [bacterium]|nr:RlmE family RNA methyltransferase [bacterium]MDB4433445.1 RlmE family RNA methyltransferase [bacterium]